MQISEAFIFYAENYITIKGLSQRVRETNIRVGEKIADFLDDKEIEELTVEDVGRWVKHISVGRSTNTVRNDVGALRSVLRYLGMLGLPCLNYELVPLPKRRDSLPTFLTEDEVSSMIEVAYNLRNAFVIALLYSSGIRLSEMIRLNRGDIVDGRFAIIGKGGKARLCFVDQRTEFLMTEYLESRKDNHQALIVSYKNKARMTPTNVQLLVANTARRAGVQKKVTPHTLRHSFATNFLKNNGNLRYLQRLMGHANLNTTAHYSHVVDVDLERQYRQYHSC